MDTEPSHKEDPPILPVSTMSRPPSLRPPTKYFIPKPFPPPALRDVPEVYIVSQLHRLAPNYWHRPETADCTIIVPCDASGPKSANPPHPDPLTTGPFRSDENRGRSGRRESEPLNNPRRMVLKLHQDYLAAQSLFLRTLLGGSSPLDLNSSATKSTSLTSSTLPRSSLRPSPSHLTAGAFPLHPSRHPRVLPSSRPNHPVIFLPVPDSTSLPHLIHYIYSGKFGYMEECLHRGIITWQGVVRNVEFLGMRLELKAYLGRYHRQWLRPNTPQVQEPASDSPPENSESEAEDDKSEMSVGSESGEGMEKIEDDTRKPPGAVIPPLG